MRTKEEVYKLEIAVGEKNLSLSITPLSGRVIGVVVYHNKGKGLYANLGIKDDEGAFISKLQHIDNYRSREACYFTGCKPVDFQTKGGTYYIEIKCDKEIQEEAFKGQLILIYQDTRFDNCTNE